MIQMSIEHEPSVVGRVLKTQPRCSKREIITGWQTMHLLRLFMSLVNELQPIVDEEDAKMAFSGAKRSSC